MTLPLTLRRTALSGPHLLCTTPRIVPSRLFASEASPGHSSNAKNPLSSGGASQSINVSRGKEARSSETADTRSVQSPISSQSSASSEAHEGEERTSVDAQIKNDPGESAETKRANVEKAGRRKLGPEDEQCFIDK
ncbi:hypothetical protein BJY01DRAFT_246743 [Aspergillus pseudoustus]|uniref:Uncharacterized protein n=1 Tax=Aspergillus pseudoustus TaxID=1810923 RepID=A0ABR4K5D0_9EURO